MSAASSDTTTLREISINTYLRELSRRDECLYDYGIVKSTGWHLLIRKEDKSDKSRTMKQVFCGPMTVVDPSCDLYCVEFKKAGVRCMIEFFM